jgi:hypothetical protein
MNTLIIASVGVALVCFILYALDRRSKGEPIDWIQASKLTTFGGLLTSGVVFATTTDGVSEAMKVVTEEAQDMFVGQPSF